MTRFDQLELLERQHKQRRDFWNRQAARFHKIGNAHSVAFSIGNKNRAIAKLKEVRAQLAELGLCGSAIR